MQQNLMQMQPMMAAYYSNNVTTDHIQQYLDENKSLILKIVESQNSGKLNECAENQARLQRNLMYLAAIADSQPQPATMHSQFAAAGILQPGVQYMQQPQQQQQAQAMTPQALMAARSSMLYSQQAYSALQQSQALHSQMGMSSAGTSALNINMLQPDSHNAGGSGSGMLGGGSYSDFGRVITVGGKHDIGSVEGRGGNPNDAGEALYLKSGDDAN